MVMKSKSAPSDCSFETTSGSDSEAGHGLDNLYTCFGAVNCSDTVELAATHALELAFDRDGYQVLVQALDQASPEATGRIARLLHGSVQKAVRSRCAHLVLKKLVEQAPSAETAFIAHELLGSGRLVAQHIYGSAVFVTLIEYFAADNPVVQCLASEAVAEDPAALCCHKIGHQVAMAVLSNGTHEQRTHILRSLYAGTQLMARHRFGSQVMEHALILGSSALATELISPGGAVVSLACHSFGVNVVRVLLESPEHHDEVLNYLLKRSRRLSKDKYGAALLAELGFAA